MIIAKLLGGIGNQMFQYAAARAVAFRHNTILKLDLSFLKNVKKPVPRKYALNVFNIVGEFAKTEEIRRFTIPHVRNKYSFFLNKMLKTEHNVVRESHFHYDEKILRAPRDCYIDGYWQSEKYFKSIDRLIREEFTFKQPPQGKNHELAEQIKSSNAVAVHVRRGDYVAAGKTNKLHIFCGIEYYQKSFAHMAAVVQDPHFFVFGDDMQWCKENLTFEGRKTFVDHNSAQDNFEDMRLISLCKHIIIANSSFSWWAAWLNANPQHIVIAPARWFASETINTGDLYKENWIKI